MNNKTVICPSCDKEVRIVGGGRVIAAHVVPGDDERLDDSGVHSVASLVCVASFQLALGDDSFPAPGRPAKHKNSFME